MVSKKIITLFITFISVHSFLYAQSEKSHINLISQIDSIASANNIEFCTVNINMVTTKFNDTATASYSLEKKGKFSFDGQFLIAGNTYFNLYKLLYFSLKEDYIEFVFQGY